MASRPSPPAGERSQKLGPFVFGFAVALLISLPVVVFGFDLAADSVLDVLGSALWALLVVGLLACALFLKREAIAEYVRERVERGAREVFGPAQEGELLASVKNFMQLYAWFQVRRWAVNTIVALLASVAAFAGSAILWLQTTEIRKQTAIVEEQTREFVRQNKLIRDQVTLQANDSYQTRKAGLIQTVFGEERCGGSNGKPKMCLVAGLRARRDAALAFIAIQRDRGEVHADLRGVDLSSVKVNCKGAPSEERCTHRNADLSGYDLSNAILRDAKLNGADLSDADLRGTDFHGADLSNVSLVGADLRGANLEKATLGSAKLDDARLEAARGWRVRGVPLQLPSGWTCLRYEGTRKPRVDGKQISETEDGCLLYGPSARLHTRSKGDPPFELTKLEQKEVPPAPGADLSGLAKAGWEGWSPQSLALEPLTTPNWYRLMSVLEGFGVRAEDVRSWRLRLRQAVADIDAAEPDLSTASPREWEQLVCAHPLLRALIHRAQAGRAAEKLDRCRPRSLDGSAR